MPSSEDQRPAKPAGNVVTVWTLLLPTGISVFVAHAVYVLHSADASYLELSIEVFSATVCLLFCVVTTYPVFTTIMWAMNIGQNWLIPRQLAQFCVVFWAWNTHLIVYAAFIWPFLFSSLLFGRECCPTYMSVILDYLIFVTLVPSPTCMGTAMMKIWTAKAKGQWGLKQQVMLGMTVAWPSLVLFWYYYHFAPQKLGPVLSQAVVWHAYTVTWVGQPELTGAREMKWFRYLDIWQLLVEFFNLKLVLHNHDQRSKHPGKGGKGGKGGLLGYDAGSHGCVLGYHPHGIIPYTAGAMQLSPDWRRLFPDVEPKFMTDAFTHSIPGMRDAIQWLGCREVSSRSLSKTLNEKECVLLVPGGQAELFSSTSRTNEVWFDRSHQGFIRHAIEHGASLVPIVSMGEWNVMDNVSIPIIQNPVRRYLGFPLPFIPYGSLPCTPRRCDITILIGEPIVFSQRTADPSAELVDKVHNQYFEQVQEMFDSHKKSCGFENHTLHFMYKQKNHIKSSLSRRGTPEKKNTTQL